MSRVGLDFKKRRSVIVCIKTRGIVLNGTNIDSSTDEKDVSESDMIVPDATRHEMKTARAAVDSQPRKVGSFPTLPLDQVGVVHKQ